MRAAVRAALAAFALLAAACQHHDAASPAPTRSPDPVVSVRGFWPFSSNAEIRGWETDPSTYPWAEDRVAVVQHFADEVLRRTDLTAVARCQRTCVDVDLRDGSGHELSRVELAAHRTRHGTVWSVVDGVTRDVELGLFAGGYEPFVTNVHSTRGVPARMYFQDLHGQVLSERRTPARKDWVVGLRRPSAARVLVVDSGRGLLFSRAPTQTNPVATTACASTTVAIQSTGSFDVGIPGQVTIGYTITNTGTRNCALYGYPELRYRDAKGPIPFVVRPGGGNGYRDLGPHRVLLRPGDVALLPVPKAKCYETQRLSDVLQITLPGLAPAEMEDHVTYCGTGPLRPTAIAASFEDLTD